MRDEAPDGLDTEPLTVVEGFMKQEALRYRVALIEVERAAGSLAREMADPLAKDALTRVAGVATEALDAGDEAAG